MDVTCKQMLDVLVVMAIDRGSIHSLVVESQFVFSHTSRRVYPKFCVCGWESM